MIFIWRKIFEEYVGLKYICQVSVTTNMEVLQELQFSAAVSDGTCY